MERARLHFAAVRDVILSSGVSLQDCNLPLVHAYYERIEPDSPQRPPAALRTPTGELPPVPSRLLAALQPMGLDPSSHWYQLCHAMHDKRVNDSGRTREEVLACYPGCVEQYARPARPEFADKLACNGLEYAQMFHRMLDVLVGQPKCKQEQRALLLMGAPGGGKTTDVIK